MAEAHEGIVGGHFSANITLHKILTALYWWPTMKEMFNLIAPNATSVKVLVPKSQPISNPYISLCLLR